MLLIAPSPSTMTTFNFAGRVACPGLAAFWPAKTFGTWPSVNNATTHTLTALLNPSRRVRFVINPLLHAECPFRRCFHRSYTRRNVSGFYREFEHGSIYL